VSVVSRERFFARLSDAQDLVSAQAQCSPDAALVLIVDRALTGHKTVGAIADAVLDKSIRFAD
jgi:hypothetical protein